MKKTIHYEKMILSKDGDMLNKGKMKSLIFVDLLLKPSWDGSNITYYMNVIKKYEFEPPTLNISGSSEYGNGYKCFVPNVTRYDSNYSYLELKKIKNNMEGDSELDSNNIQYDESIENEIKKDSSGNY